MQSTLSWRFARLDFERGCDERFNLLEAVMNGHYHVAHERRFLFLCASARRNGNSVMLARAAAASLPSTYEQQWLHLSDLNLPPFEDLRHEVGRKYTSPQKGAEIALKATVEATDLIFVTPLYWYGLPATAKLYLDHWSAWMRLPGLDFRDQMAGKRLGAIVVLSDLQPAKAEPLIASLRLTAEYMRMDWSGELVGVGNRPGDILNDLGGMNRAAQLFNQTASPGSLKAEIQRDLIRKSG